MRSVTLWKAEFSREAYTDQCGLSHSGRIVCEEITVPLSCERLVNGDYSGEIREGQIGYRGISADGRFFECNWEDWPDTSSSPYWIWYETDKNREVINFEWFNVVNVCGFHPVGPFVRNNELAIPHSDSVGYCKLHKKCYSDGDDCYKCDIERRLLQKERGAGQP